MNCWRLLPCETNDPYKNMAIDEAVLKARIAGIASNTLRFYKWKPSAVSVGRFQMTEKEVQIGNCLKFGVAIVRRITGGGTVYHDSGGEITYSVIARKQDLGNESIEEVYRRVYACIVRGLENLGVIADFKDGDARACPNLTVNGRKISGSSQSHRSGVVLQHGTILTDVDVEKMLSFIRGQNGLCLNLVAHAKSKITSLRTELNRRISDEEVCSALVSGFSQRMNLDMLADTLTPTEYEWVEELVREKYSRSEWNMKGETMAR